MAKLLIYQISYQLLRIQVNFVVGLAQVSEQWGIWNTDDSSGKVICAFPVANTSKTFAVLTTYFDAERELSNGAFMVKNLELDQCTLRLWDGLPLFFIVIGK